MARKVTYDPDKVKELRMSLVQASLDVMEEKTHIKKWSQFKKELILRMAPRILPQLNAGRDDDKDLFPEPLLAGKSNDTNNGDTKTPVNEKENP